MTFGLRVAPDRRLGWLAVGTGMLVAVALQLSAPVRVPLYDGVVVNEPYRYLHPTGSHAGSPTSTAIDVPVVGETSPAFAAATSENPPQAQLIAQQGAFTLPTGSISLHVSITPIEAPPPPADGVIAGNVYALAVTDQTGAPLTATQCDGCLSLSMRAPEGTDTGTLERYDNGTWTALETLPVGVVSMFQANVAALGDVAVIVKGSSTPGGGGPGGAGIDPVVLFGVGAVGLWLVVFAFIAWRRVRPDPVPARASRNKGIPSKQRPPKRPGSGRTSS